ncbi:MAG: hypothetical protein DWQ37_08595 [Planctomycetota bacterium]|nr:MAG: hypothetical protein DWQ37_08595 [Planctomycetota bacterium]
MHCLVLAIQLCALSQAPGEGTGYQPIRVPVRQSAPAAEIGDFGQEPAASPGATAGAREATVPPPADPAMTDDSPERRADPYGNESEPGNAPGGEMESVGDRPPQRLRPPELIAAALEAPKQHALAGTPMKLAEAIARTPDRQRQLQVTKAYWRLAAAQAAYHWAVEQRDVVFQHTEQETTRADLLSTQAAAEADAGDARLAVEKAQAELAHLIGSVGNAAPLTVDRPHVGEYRTYFESIFSGRAAPPPIWLIQRTLPVRRKAIDAHGSAVVAAADAVEAAADQFQSTGQGITTLIDSLELLARERSAFIELVRDYNLDIADYAFAVAPPGAASDTLVSMLIRKPSVGEPRRASSAPHNTFRNTPPTGDGAQNGRPAGNSAIDDWAANYPGDLDATAAVDDPALYQALLELTSVPLRVQKLGDLLHWDRNLPPDSGEPATLADCLGASAGPGREAIIQAFWKARESAAHLQVLGEQLEQLNTLQAIAIPQRDQPGMAEAGVRLQAARLAARAALIDAQLDLISAQFDLMTATGRPLEQAWIVPGTTPQSGRYRISRRSKTLSAEAAARAEQVAAAYTKLHQRGQAVVQCDVHRAALILEARNGASGSESVDGRLSALDRAIWAIGRQNQQTLGFLDDLTEYNEAIANYVLTTQPASLSATELSGKLAIGRSTSRDS